MCLICCCVIVMQLEMRSQDRQLAQTLLGLNKEIQRLRRENGSLLLDADSTEHLWPHRAEQGLMREQCPGEQMGLEEWNTNNSPVLECTLLALCLKCLVGKNTESMFMYVKSWPNISRTGCWDLYSELHLHPFTPGINILFDQITIEKHLTTGVNASKTHCNHKTTSF